MFKVMVLSIAVVNVWYFLSSSTNEKLSMCRLCEASKMLLLGMASSSLNCLRLM